MSASFDWTAFGGSAASAVPKDVSASTKVSTSAQIFCCIYDLLLSWLLLFGQQLLNEVCNTLER